MKKNIYINWDRRISSFDSGHFVPILPQKCRLNLEILHIELQMMIILIKNVFFIILLNYLNLWGINYGVICSENNLKNIKINLVKKKRVR